MFNQITPQKMHYQGVSTSQVLAETSRQIKNISGETVPLGRRAHEKQRPTKCVGTLECGTLHHQGVEAVKAQLIPRRTVYIGT